MKISETIQYKLVKARTKYKDRYDPGILKDINSLLNLVRDIEVKSMDIDEAIRICQTIGECEVGTIRKIAISTMIEWIKQQNSNKKVTYDDKKE